MSEERLVRGWRGRREERYLSGARGGLWFLLGRAFLGGFGRGAK